MVKRDKFQVILEKCIGQLQEGSSVEECLSQYPEHRERLEPLLRTALRISAIETAKPSDEFVAASRIRILNQIRPSAAELKASRGKSRTFADFINDTIRDAFRRPVSLRRYALPVAITIVLAAFISIGQLFYFRPSPVLAAPCTLNVFTGDVEVRVPETGEWVDGTNKMVLDVGTIIKTSESSHAILTFFTGSTSIKLEPSTELVLQQLDSDDENSTITLMQTGGKTWSFVSPSESGGTVYMVDTPSASATASGTLFTVEIDDEGSTTVATTEGKVKVKAQDGEVVLSSMEKVKVKPGEVPPEPVAIIPPTTEITLSANKGIAASITDPNGLSTGNLESGFSYNQITGSQSIVYSDGPQVITIPEPVNGKYVIMVSCESPGATKFNINITSDDKEVYKCSVSLPANKQNLWLIYLDVTVEDGLISDAAVDDVEALSNKDIDDVVTVSPTVKEQEKAKSQSEKKKDSQDEKDKNKNKDSVETEEEAGEDKDNRGQEQKDGDKDNKGQEQKDEDKDNKGQDKKEEGDTGTQDNSGSSSEDKDNKGQDQKDNNSEDKDNNGNKDSDDKESKNKDKDKDKTKK